MTNQNVAGIGNIYANETLFAAGIAPETPVNLTETDSRTMSTEEIVALYPTGQLDDAYVWKEGMDDWVPVLEVAELPVDRRHLPSDRSPRRRPRPAHRARSRARAASA